MNPRTRRLFRLLPLLVACAIVPGTAAAKGPVTGGPEMLYPGAVEATVARGNLRVGAESGVPRGEVFVTTKLWNSDHGYDAALEACDRSLEQLGTDRVDLYLVHWPVERLRHDTWRAMERILEEGKARAIGVSNYTVRHLDELLARCNVPPSVNQVEFHPFLYQRELLDHCARHRIRLEAYAPLIGSHENDDGWRSPEGVRSRIAGKPFLNAASTGAEKSAGAFAGALVVAAPTCKVEHRTKPATNAELRGAFLVFEF